MTSSFATQVFQHPGGGRCYLRHAVQNVGLRDRCRDFFARSERPREPGVLRLKDVIFAERGDAACLYDRDGRRIDASAMRRANRDGAFEPYRAAEILNDVCVVGEIEEPVIFHAVFIPHWGHFLLESIARLWPQDERLSLFAYSVPTGDPAPPYSTFLSAAGLRLAPWRSVAGEIRLAECFVPDPTFEVNGSAHPLHLEAPHRVARALLGDDRPDERPVYFSRSRLDDGGEGRRIVNEREFEAALAARGVRIAHMERLTLAEQIEVMNTHCVFIGTAGSAMHNILFSLRGGEVTTFTLLFGPFPSNYMLIDGIVGNDAHYLDVMRSLARDPNGLIIDVPEALSYLTARGVL